MLLYHSVFIYESQPFLPFSVLLESALFCRYTIALILSHSLCLLSRSLALLYSACCPAVSLYRRSASKFPLFSFSNADSRAKMTTNGHHDCLHIYYLILFAI